MAARERIVAMSLVAGGVVAMVNSTVWAAATCFMAYQKARVRIAEAHERAYARLERTAPHQHRDSDAESDLDDDGANELPPDSLTLDSM